MSNPIVIRYAPTKLGFSQVISLGMQGRVYFQQYRHTDMETGKPYLPGMLELVFEDSYESEADAIELFNRSHGFS